MIERVAVEAALHRLYIAAAGTALRSEDRKKSLEIVGILSEIERWVEGHRSPSRFRLVDAAAGKAYVGLLAAELIFAPRSRPLDLTVIEREAARASACTEASARLSTGEHSVRVVQADVADPAAWPEQPDLVVALHACGPASDTVSARAVACEARGLLLVPCCTSDAIPAARLAARRAESIGLPRHAEVRRRFVQAFVDGDRTLALEAAGYETNVVSFVPPTVTPHHLLWRARRVREPGRMAEADRRRALLGGG
jgi:hypothetical protein